MKLTALVLKLMWVGDGDGPSGLRTTDEPGLADRILALTDSVGWGQPVRLDLDPKGDGIGHGPGQSRGPGTGPDDPFPVISWRVEVREEATGEVLGEAELNAHPLHEGDVNERGLPLGLGTRPYDESKGYGLLVRAGWRRTFTRSNGVRYNAYKPASSGRLLYSVRAFPVDEHGRPMGPVSNVVTYPVS